MKEIGSEFTLYDSGENYFDNIKKKVNSMLFLRSGRDAIGYVADLIAKKSGIVLLPAYSCVSMSDPFLIRGWEVIYYPINLDFSVDVQFLLSLSEEYKPDIVLIMNFFGISDTKNLTYHIKSINPEVKIIEDVTHILFDLDKQLDKHIDYLVGSIRKWFGITDGAIVISKSNKIPNIRYIESDFINLRKEALKLKEEFLHTNELSLKQRYRELFADAEVSLGKGETPHYISPESLNYLYKLNVESMKKIRTWNANKLLQLLRTIPEVNFPDNIDLINQRTPFSIPIFINERDNKQKRLAENGIYAALLWPLSEKARNISPAAEEIEKTMLSIPIDQRYDYADMELVFNVIKNVI